MDFFPEDARPSEDEDIQEQPQPIWAGPPEDTVPGVVPLEIILGRSDTGVVFLTGIQAFPAGLGMSLGVRVRGRLSAGDLNGEIFDEYRHPRDAEPGERADRLKWGFELSDGRRVTNVDPSPYLEQPNQDHHRPHHPDDWKWEPDHPVLQGLGGGGGSRSVNRDYWLWPLPLPGRLRVVCQWPARSIELTVQDLDADVFLAAARRAQPLWPT